MWKKIILIIQAVGPWYYIHGGLLQDMLAYQAIP